jgi:hypothetical protein
MLRAFRPVAVTLLLLSGAVLAQAPVSPAEMSPADPAPTGGTAPPLQACAAKAYDDYAAAMSGWEHEWAVSVTGARQDFSAAASARASAHSSALQRDGYRIHYLAANLPDDLDLDDTIASLRLFDWTPAEEQALRQTQPSYAVVADAATHDRQVADAQPKAEELESYFEDTFSTGAGSGRRLRQILETGNAALEQCHKASLAAGPKVEPQVRALPVAATRL